MITDAERQALEWAEGEAGTGQIIGSWSLRHVKTLAAAVRRLEAENKRLREEQKLEREEHALCRRNKEHQWQRAEAAEKELDAWKSTAEDNYAECEELSAALKQATLDVGELRERLKELEEVFGTVAYLLARAIQERDFTAPEKQHRLVVEARDALAKYEGKVE